LNPDTEHLLESIYKSNDDLVDLEDKVYKYKVDQQNFYGQKLLNVFKKNIILAKQNNNLLENFLNYSKIYYNKAVMRYHTVDEGVSKDVLDRMEQFKAAEIERVIKERKGDLEDINNISQTINRTATKNVDKSIQK
jgi:hypothetical protein